MNKIIVLFDCVQTMQSCKNKVKLQKNSVRLSVTAKVLNFFRRKKVFYGNSDRIWANLKYEFVNRT